MIEDKQFTILCLASYEKGQEFMREAKRQGARVILITSESLREIDWPKESLDAIYYIPDDSNAWDTKTMMNGINFLARTEVFDRIVALDDFDVEKAAMVREHLRIGGMGDTTARYFRDKLAMRTRAFEKGIAVPPFLHVLNHDQLNDFFAKIEPPYVIKPRMQAGSIGIKKVYSAQEAWDVINSLGDQQSYYLIEKFIQGNVCHVDSIINNKEVIYSLSSKYGTPPMEVAHEGRVFTTRTLKQGSELDKQLREFNGEVLFSLGLVYGVSHTEFIEANDGKLYFLETSARVGGAHIVELIEAATGMNLWAEWAKLETLDDREKYELPKIKKNFAALLNSLAKQEYPNLDQFNDKEVVWRLKKQYHAGLVISSPKEERIDELLKNYTQRFYDEFFAFTPMKDRPTN